MNAQRAEEPGHADREVASTSRSARYTLEEVDEARVRLRVQRAEQGLPPHVTEPAALAPLARALRRLRSARADAPAPG